MDELPGLIAVKTAAIAKLQSEITNSEQSLDAALKEMNLIPTSIPIET